MKNKWNSSRPCSTTYNSMFDHNLSSRRTSTAALIYFSLVVYSSKVNCCNKSEQILWITYGAFLRVIQKGTKPRLVVFMLYFCCSFVWRCFLCSFIYLIEAHFWCSQLVVLYPLFMSLSCGFVKSFIVFSYIYLFFFCVCARAFLYSPQSMFHKLG